MFCPNCKNFMKNNSFEFYSMADWDSDEPSLCEEFVCPHCNIQYINGEWNIPTSLKPSVAQEKAVLFICSTLHLVKPFPLKTTYWSFINQNIDEAKFVKNSKKYPLIDINDIYEEYFLE